jgi:hypothetical protein
MTQQKPLSLKDFKNWFAEQKDMSEFFNIGKEPEDPNAKFIGKKVRPKVSESKLMDRIVTDDDPEELVVEFMSEGGKILEIEGKMVYIETSSGQFQLPRFCVKVKKD